jgi:V8-like Glu-specific endopeptidase
VIDSNTNTLFNSPINFYANMINGAKNHPATASYVWWGTNKPDTYRESDWALLRLDKNLGDEQGWFATKEVSIDAMKNTDATLVGYSLDFRGGQTAGIHRSCKITKQASANFFLHDCDMTRGASGGPIFAYWDNEPTIFALNVAEFRNGGGTSLALPQYTDQNANIAIWSNELQNKIRELRAS